MGEKFKVGSKVFVFNLDNTNNCLSNIDKKYLENRQKGTGIITKIMYSTNKSSNKSSNINNKMFIVRQESGTSIYLENELKVFPTTLWNICNLLQLASKNK